ncbi:MAG: ABC transporter permease [Methanomassiliicoccales archaeon]|nr:ABC transporter permease [Methanomassiliicoccales archaeon]
MTRDNKLIYGWIRKATGLDNIKMIIFIIISLAGFIGVWWLIAEYIYISEYLPTPLLVWDAFINSFTHRDPVMGIDMWQNISSSLQRFAYGFLLAFIIAVPAGLLMGFSKLLDMLIKPVVEVFRPIPPIAWVPIFLLALGIFWGPIVVIFIGVFFPLLSNVYFGVKSVDPVLLDAARTQGAGRFDIFGKVILPSTVPFIMTGIRIGLGIGWMCIVAAEMIGARGGGVGYYISIQGQIGNYPGMFAGIAVIAILGILTTGVMGQIEKKLNQRMGF